MAGNATLGSNLVDSLVPGVIDGIRDALHPSLGVRQFRVYAVTRTYTTEFGGDAFTDAEEELIPWPLVEPYTDKGTRMRNDLEPCGVDEAGIVYLREISLQYTEAQIAGPPPDPHMQDFFLRIDDANGQQLRSRYFVPDSPPYPDRINDMGWTMRCRRASDAAAAEGA